MKNITLTVIDRSDGNVRFTVKNSHRNQKFGKFDDTFKASNGFSITSRYEPEVSNHDEVLYVQGETSSKDNECLVAENVKFTKIEAAVAEYNKTFGGGLINDKPRLKIRRVYFNATTGAPSIRVETHGPMKNITCFQIVECSGFEKGKVYNFGGVEFSSDRYVNVIRDSKIEVWGSCATDKDALLFVSQDGFLKIENAIKLMNEAADKPDFIKTITFVYKNGAAKTRRLLKVVSEDATHVKGIDVDKGESGEFRSFLKSKMVDITEFK